MNSTLKKIFSIIIVIIILIASVIGWLAIEVGYDGCCGAPANYENDSKQSLTHLAAYGAAGLLVWFTLRWGWRSKK